MKIRTLILFVFMGTIALFSCDKDDTDLLKKEELSFPATYNFDNVDYSGQTTRLDMLEEITNYMKTANTSGVSLDAAKLKKMYANANAAFAAAALNTSGKQLKDKTYISQQAKIEEYIDSLVANSNSQVTGSKGVAGVVSNAAGVKYLMNGNGVEYIQLIEKGLMGSAFYYQAVSFYLENIAVKDNVTVTPGKGTEMEHSWDEAFGYFGVAKDFPTNLAGARFWGKYAISRNALLGSNKKIMDAFLMGRAAISAKDYAKRDEAINTIRTEWEIVSAATAISYLNQAKANFTDDAVRNHVLSEAHAFIDALNYNVNKKITSSQVAQALGFIGNNYYEVTVANLDKARDLLSTIYGLDAVKTSL